MVKFLKIKMVDIGDLDKLLQTSKVYGVERYFILKNVLK
jgi:hypothetical protein